MITTNPYKHNCRKYLITLIIFALLAITSVAEANFGIVPNLIGYEPQSGAFPLVVSGKPAGLYYDSTDYQGVIRAIGDLLADIERVTDIRPGMSDSTPVNASIVVIGTLGKNKIIDSLAASGKLATSELAGKWESYIIETVKNPMPGIDQMLVIVGSDKRGTIFGIYEISEQIGVSPWYWWADVPTEKHDSLFILPGRYASGEPKVKYRGIFINDENRSMRDWARAKFGGMNSKMYAHVFELLLRLRANCLWPGMWGAIKEYEPDVPMLKDQYGNYEGNSFNEDDPENPRLADEYGIVMGTSHHEPMQRSQQEWIRSKANYGNGQWNYVTNKDGLKKFFREGIANTKDYESLITIGMRGDDDKPMVDAGSAQENFRVLEGIMKDQREIIEEVAGKEPEKLQQVWTLYSEVLDYFDQGMHVPDDVIIVLCDNNWGDVRRLPELNGPRHPAGYGMYYHVAYYGAPRASKWLNITQNSQMWEQLKLTYDYDVDKIWILNVGDIKPLEYPIAFFMSMAWDPERFTIDNFADYGRYFCAEMFGPEHASMAARILDTSCKYNSRIFPEMLDEKTYNLQSGEFELVRNEYMALEAMALRQYLTISDQRKDTYKQIILFPVQAMANLYDMYYSLAMNRKLASEGDLRANYWADQVEYCFNRDKELCYDYNHNIADGKWNHMMDQPHIGYQSWHGPQFNIMPEVSRVKPEQARVGGYIFNETNGVVVMEAEHFFQSEDSDGSQWQVIDDMGRTLSGIGLMPATVSTNGAALSYKMKLNTKPKTVKVRIIADSTMPFIKGGHSIAVGFDGGEEKSKVINADFNWANVYNKMYPTGAARINEIEFSFDLPEADSEGLHTLTLRPLNPGLIFHKVIADCGGYQQTFLKMPESMYKR